MEGIKTVAPPEATGSQPAHVAPGTAALRRFGDLVLRGFDKFANTLGPEAHVPSEQTTLSVVTARRNLHEMPENITL